MKNHLNLFVIAGLSLIILGAKLLPHQANFTPVLALCLWAGSLGKKHWLSLILPLAALLLSDWFIGFYPGWALNYICFTFLIVSGLAIKPKFFSFVGFGFFGALAFFVISNFGVWAFTDLYMKTWQGLLQCYTLSLPFFHSTLLSTCAFMGLFFWVDQLLLKTVLEPAVREAS